MTWSFPDPAAGNGLPPQPETFFLLFQRTFSIPNVTLYYQLYFNSISWSSSLTLHRTLSTPFFSPALLPSQLTLQLILLVSLVYLFWNTFWLSSPFFLNQHFWSISSILMAPMILYLVVTSKRISFLNYTLTFFGPLYSTPYWTFPGDVPPAPQTQLKQTWIPLFPVSVPLLSVPSWSMELPLTESSKLEILEPAEFSFIFISSIHLRNKSHGFFWLFLLHFITALQSFSSGTSDIFS